MFLTRVAGNRAGARLSKQIHAPAVALGRDLMMETSINSFRNASFTTLSNKTCNPRLTSVAQGKLAVAESFSSVSTVKANHTNELVFRRNMTTAVAQFKTEPNNIANPIGAEPMPPKGLEETSYSLEEIMDSVIKVYCTSSSPNYLSPWQNKPIRSQTGSGFVIDGKRIITNAHVVADALQVMVRRPGSPVKFPARVVASGHECDLAVLHVDSDEFWEPYLQRPETVIQISEAQTVETSRLEYDPRDGLPTSVVEAAEPSTAIVPTRSKSKVQPTVPHYKGLQFCDWIPLLQDDVCVIGYPMGGDNACITQGVVSRVEPVVYAHAATHLLAVQIDAAINPGNSGGPAFVDGKVVGVAFQNIQNANNVGYIIPVPIIRHFLNDVDHGGYKVASPGTSEDYSATGEPLSDLEKQQKLETARVEREAGAMLRRGFCSMGILCQSTSNATLQRFLGMLPSTSIVASSSTSAGGSAGYMNAAASIASTASHHNTPSNRSHGFVGDVARSSMTSLSSHVSSSSNSKVEVANTPTVPAPTQEVTAQPKFTFAKAALPAAFAHAPPHTQATLVGLQQRTSVGTITQEEAINVPGLTTGLQLARMSSNEGSSMAHSADEPLTGVLVNKVDIYSPCYGVLQRNDVLVAIDGHPIACDGTVAFRGRERISFDYLISLKYAGDTARLAFLRRKDDTIELIERDVAMRPLDHLVSVFEYDRLPSYFVFAGVVCVPLTQPFLHEFGKDWFNSAPRDLVQLALQGSPQFPKQEVVLLAQILPADCTFGYSNMQDLQVKAVNGVRVRNLLHFSRLVERAILRGAEKYEHELDLKRSMAPHTLTSAEVSSTRNEFTGVSSSSPFKDYLLRAKLSILPEEDRNRLTMRGWDASDVDPDDVDPLAGSAPPVAQSPLAEDPNALVLELSDHRLLVLDLRAAAQQHTRILATHRVPQDRSEGLGL